MRRHAVRGRTAAMLTAALLSAAALAACHSDQDADATRNAAGEVAPGAVAPGPGTEPDVPAGGLAGGRGSAGDNTGEVSLDSVHLDARADSSRSNPIVRPTTPDTLHRVPTPQGGLP